MGNDVLARNAEEPCGLGADAALRAALSARRLSGEVKYTNQLNREVQETPLNVAHLHEALADCKRRAKEEGVRATRLSNAATTLRTGLMRALNCMGYGDARVGTESDSSEVDPASARALSESIVSSTEVVMSQLHSCVAQHVALQDRFNVHARGSLEHTAALVEVRSDRKLLTQI